jgi:hypothetical protein
MATQGLRANNSEYLRSILDHGEVCRYTHYPRHADICFLDDSSQAIFISYNDVNLLFIDHGDEFGLAVVGEYDDRCYSAEFSYDHSDREIKMFLEASVGEYFPLDIDISDDQWMLLGEDGDPGEIHLCNRDCTDEHICNDLIYLFDDVGSYVNKVKQVVERMNAEPEEFSKDRFIALMTEKRCKSARK